MAKKRANARQKAVKKLDKVFSTYVRYSAIDEYGCAECYTCGKRDHPRNMHCGHFASRRHMATRWSEDNTRVQCVACNIMRQGEQYRFGRRLDSENAGLPDRILQQAERKKRYTITDIERLADAYAQRSEGLVERCEAIFDPRGCTARSVSTKGKKTSPRRRLVRRR